MAPPTYHGPEWDTPTRTRVIQMRLDKVPSYKIQEQTGVPRRSQYNIAQSGPRRPGASRPGPKHKVDKDTIEKMRHSLKGHYNERKKRWDEWVEDLNLDVTPRTVKKAAYDARPRLKKGKAAQKKWITTGHAEKRMAWCQERENWEDWQWKQVVFSDETHMHHNARAADQVIREPGERMAPDAIQKKLDKGPMEIHVWAAIGYNFKSKLIFYGMSEGDLTKSNMTLK
ncbi:MAG: hypothetical protein M1823_002947, partial [Watsoniomyces obsoletus]